MDKPKILTADWLSNHRIEFGSIDVNLIKEFIKVVENQEKWALSKDLEKLHLFFHNVGMDPTGELAKKYSISHANCQLTTQEDFLKAENVCAFIIKYLFGDLPQDIPDIGKEIKKILDNQK